MEDFYRTSGLPYAAASAELEAAQAVVVGVPPPAYGARDVRFERLYAADREVAEQLRNVKNCCYFASRQ